MIGESLGAYDIVEKLGEGGMGQVYRAFDTRLKRDVAIKVLPPSVSADAERLARFQREAELLAALNHPHIAAVYGLERTGGVTALVMELVAGDDLSVRLSRGPVPLDEALPIATQLAGALEAAHEQGIIHRDLKPANIKIRPDGTVKVLDFGLAKALSVDQSLHSSSGHATITSPAVTQLGVILGTAAYMAPEQARGRAVDRRADIWAFGCVLYEMIAGTRPFDADDVTDLMTAILRDEPKWAALPAPTPVHVTELLRRCLEKDPKQRLRDIGEARIALDRADHRERGATAATASAAHRTNVLQLALASVAGAAVVSAALLWRGPERVVPEARAFEIVNGRDVRDPRVSPDGRHVAFVRNGRLFVRSLSSFDAKEIAGIENASNPFWSPDSASIGYFAVREIRAVPIAGGASRVLAQEVFAPYDACWCRAGVVFTRWAKGLWLADEAGRVTQLTPLDAAAGQQNLAYPSCLADGRLLAIAVVGKDPNRETSSQMVLVDGGRTSRLFELPGEGIFQPILVPPGRIVFTRGGANTGLWSAPVSPDLSAITGAPALVQANGWDPSVSDDGLLVALSGLSYSGVRLTWVDRTGRALGQIGKPLGEISEISLAPDGTGAAATGRERAGEVVWIHRPNGAQRFVDGEMLAWSARGDAIAYQADGAVYVRSTAGDSAPRRVIDTIVQTLSWTPDGTRIIYAVRAETRGGIRIRSADGSDDRLFVADAGGGAVSPDGRWLAYHANSGSGFEVFLTSFPETGRVWPVSSGPGRHPQWSAAGELFFAGGSTIGDDPNSLRDLYSVTIDSKDGHPSTPVKLFDADAAGYRLTLRASRAYAVARDGQRFLVPTSGVQGQAVVTAIQNVQAWR